MNSPRISIVVTVSDGKGGAVVRMASEEIPRGMSVEAAGRFTLAKALEKMPQEEKARQVRD